MVDVEGAGGFVGVHGAGLEAESFVAALFGFAEDVFEHF